MKKNFLGTPAAATAAGGRRRVAVSKPKFDIIKLTPNVDVCKKPHLNIFKNTPLNPPPYIKYCKWDIPFQCGILPPDKNPMPTPRQELFLGY